MAVGDENGRLRRAFYAAGVEAYEESFRSETRARAYARACARARAQYVSPRGAKQKPVGAPTFRRHVPNDSARWARMITGRLNAAPGRESCRYRSGTLQIESRLFRGSKEPDGCARRNNRQLKAPSNRQRREHASAALRSGRVVVRNRARQSVYETCSLDIQEPYQRSLGVDAWAS